MSSVMAALAPCQTRAIQCTARACHLHKQAFSSLPSALLIVTLALHHHKLMYAADVLLMRALPSLTLRGVQAFIWAAAGSEQALQAPNRRGQDLCQLVTTSLNFLLRQSFFL